MSVPILQSIKWWKCPSCGLVDRTERGGVFTQMHSCPALGGICLPLVEVPKPDADPHARHVLTAREDYCGEAGVSPITAVRTERSDGSNDCTVLAPVARSGASAHL